MAATFNQDDALYLQAAKIVCKQISALDTTGRVTDGIGTGPDGWHVRTMDWDDVLTVKSPVTVRIDEPREWAGTNMRDDRGYPIYLVFYEGSRDRAVSFQNWVMVLKQKARRYYNNQRRMNEVTDEGTLCHPTKVTEGRVPSTVSAKHSVHVIVIWASFRESRDVYFRDEITS